MSKQAVPRDQYAMTLEEIAQEMNMTKGQVGMVIARVLKKLGQKKPQALARMSDLCAMRQEIKQRRRA